MYEVSLGLIKPFGGYENKIKILGMVDGSNLDMPFIKDPYFLSREKAGEHYIEQKGLPFYDSLIAMMTGNPTLLFLVTGENAIERFRNLCGATDPKSAENGTIRYRFGSRKNVAYNAVHASDSLKSAKREIELHLSPEEILELPEELRKTLENVKPYYKALIL